MLYLFHGDNTLNSRNEFNHFLDQLQNYDILRCDKDTDIQTINLFIGGQSLFSSSKAIAISNFFSFPKSSQDKVLKNLTDNPNFLVIIWQDKKLTPTQTKTLPSPKIQYFPLDNKLFSCLNSLRPKNIKAFLDLFHQINLEENYDLFLYLLKANLRRQLSTSSRFPTEQLKSTYLKLIELDYLNKTGQLYLSKYIALERIISKLLE